MARLLGGRGRVEMDSFAGVSDGEGAAFAFVFGAHSSAALSSSHLLDLSQP